MSHDKNVHDKKMHDKKSYDKKENENIIEEEMPSWKHFVPENR